MVSFKVSIKIDFTYFKLENTVVFLNIQNKMRLNAGKAYSSLKHTSGKSLHVCMCAHAMIMFRNGAYVIGSDSIALAGKW